VSVLTAMLLRYSIHLPSEKVEEYKGLTRHQQTERLLKSQAKITLTLVLFVLREPGHADGKVTRPLDVPLVFKKRE